jgi:hypothetical protein
MAINAGDRFKTIEQFWQALKVPDTGQAPYAGSINNRQALPAEGLPVSDLEVSQKTPTMPVSQTAQALRWCAVLLLILAVGAGYFAYERGYTLLLLCALGVFLLALAGLLISGMIRRLNPHSSTILRSRRDT